MTEDRVTLELKGGTVPLDIFTTAISGLEGLLKALTASVADNAKITWMIEELSVGSATATIVGQSDDPETVDRVVKAYEAVGHALQSGGQVPYSESVRKAAHKIASVLNGKVSEIRMLTAERSYAKTTPEAEVSERQNLVAYGSVEGIVQTVTNRNVLRFTLYDALYDRAVQCYLAPGQDDMMRELWEKRVIVQGLVTRDPENGRPTEIRQITKAIPVIAGDYRQGRGALKAVDESPEDAIRRIRNA